MKTAGIIAPADWLEEDMLARGVKTLESLGFAVKAHPQCTAKFGRMAGEDRVRAAAFNEYLADDSIDILWAAKGGCGCYRMLDMVDYDLWRRKPKPLVGYSDITRLAIAGYARAGVKSWIGPMVREMAKGMHPEGYGAVAGFLRGGGVSFDGLMAPAQTLAPGKGEGVLIAGTLACITSLVGTPFAPPEQDVILMVEDICEANYKLDFMLRHIRYGGGWGGRIRGLVVGGMTDIEDSESRPYGLTLDDIWKQNFPGIPIATGAGFGHGAENWPVPLGARVRLAAGAQGAALSLLA